MNAVTIQISDEMLEKIALVAKIQEVTLDTLILTVMDSVVREYEAETRFRERADRGRGREQEALELLNR